MKMKSWFGKENLPKDLYLLLLIGGLYSLSIALSNTFVNIYLWKQSSDFKDLGLYNLSIVVMQPITFIIAGRWAKKMDRVLVLRIGVIFLAFFYLTVLMTGTNATKYLLLLGSLLGIGYGFYWLAFNVLTFEITEPETRDFFNGFLGTLSSFGGMIGPFLSGIIISRMENFTGYSVVFGVSLTLFAIAVFFSFFLKRRPSEGDYLFLKIIQERKNNDNWRLVTNANFFQGLREGIFAFIISVFVFVTTGSEMVLGTFGLIQSGISLVAYSVVSRFITKERRKQAIFIGGMMLFFSAFIILFHLTYVKLLIYAAVVAIAYPLLLVPFLSMTYDVIGKGWRAGDLRIEYIVVRELFLNLGRIVSIAIFLLAITFYGTDYIPILLVILGSGYMLISLFIRKVQFTSPCFHE